MRKFLIAILILSAVFPLRAQQSPYDAFAPAENIYPILEKGCLDTIFTDTLLLVVEDEGQSYILAEFQTNPQGYVRWLTVDPRVDKYLCISPYNYCNWNPIVRIDPDGCEDFFDEQGLFIEHLDNDNDNITIRCIDGTTKGICDFNYSEDQTANLDMLSNICAYYLCKADVGVLQEKIPIKYFIINNALCTNKSSGIIQILVDQFNGTIDDIWQTASNLENALVHESEHKKGYTEDEYHSLQAQINHSSWDKTTERYKLGIGYYIAKEAQRLLKNGMCIKDIMEKLPYDCYVYHEDSNEIKHKQTSWWLK